MNPIQVSKRQLQVLQTGGGVSSYISVSGIEYLLSWILGVLLHPEANLFNGFPISWPLFMLPGRSHDKEVATTVASQCWGESSSSTSGRGRIWTYDVTSYLDYAMLLDYSYVFRLVMWSCFFCSRMGNIGTVASAVVVHFCIQPNGS